MVHLTIAYFNGEKNMFPLGYISKKCYVVKG